MKHEWRSMVVLVALAAICALFAGCTGNSAQRELEETRRSLRQQGFKLELREFNLATPPEVSRRAELLGTTTRAAITNRSRPALFTGGLPDRLTVAGMDAAVVAWKQEKLRSSRSSDLWPELREVFLADRARLAAIRQAALSGPIRFEPIGSQGPDPLLPYLADLKNLETTFGLGTMLALHDGDRQDAWTNLLAATCLVTAYEPEPIEVSHLVRFACLTIAFEQTWNALQAPTWTDEQLADLQRRWEAVDFWRGLPATAAYARAGAAALCELERRQPLSPGITLKQALQSSRHLWPNLDAYWSQLRYRHGGRYRDERALLLYYRDRELDLRRAIRSPTWSEMRQLPGVTNVARLPSLYPSRVAAQLNSRQIALAFQRQPLGLLGRAADAESRRRLMITAIALERYRGRHGSYPNTLLKLVPEFFKTVPLDFMDGQPLRYRVTDDGHFVLYSVGLDCVDDGGEMRLPKGRGVASGSAAIGLQQAPDLVWPRPASAEEVDLLNQAEQRAEQARQDDARERQAAEQWTRTARRQAKVEAILEAQPQPTTKEPAYRGRPLSEVLRNERASGTNRLTLAEMLTLKRVITGAEPETVTFELPLNYDVLTNLGDLFLCIDPSADEDSDQGCRVEQSECNRATNGNARLVWSTIFEAPGKHALQACLLLNDAAKAGEEISGPLAPFVVTNLCQFSLASAHFQPDYGVTLHARLPELNGTYTIELKAPAGERLKTITGSTSNGIIKVHWDLKDEHGKTCTNQAFDTVFHVTLPDSGRSQTLNGP